MIVDSLLVALGFEVDTAGAQEWIEKTKEAETAAIGFVGAVVAMAAAVGAATIAIAGELDELQDFADLNDVSAQTVAELGHAAQLSGSSMQDLMSSVQGLNRVTGEAALGIGRGAKLFEDMGLSAKNADGSVKSFDDILGDVADKMQGMSKQEAIALAQKLGINPTLIPLLQRGREEIAALREEYLSFGGATQEDYEAVGELMDDIDRIKAMAKASGQAIALYFLPAVKQVVAGFREWWIQNRLLIRDNIFNVLNFFSAIVTTVVDWLVRLGGVVNWIVELFGGWRVVMLALAAAMTVFVSGQILRTLSSFVAVLNAARTAVLGLLAGVGLVPILIAAAAAAIFLLIDDIVNFAEGNESVIGRLVERFPALGALITEIGQDFRTFWERLQAILAQLQPAFERLLDAFGGLFSALWGLLSPIIGGVLSLIGAALPYVLSFVETLVLLVTQLLTGIVFGITSIATVLVGTVTAVLSTLRAAFTTFFGWLTDGWDAVVNGIGSAVAKVKGWLGIGDGATAGVAAPPRGANSLAATTPNALTQNAPMGANWALQPQSNTAQSNTTVTVGAPNITINSPDPAKAGESVRQELTKMNQTVIRNNQSAVAL